MPPISKCLFFSSSIFKHNKSPKKTSSKILTTPSLSLSLMKNETDPMNSDQSQTKQHRRPKSRQVSSRFLSPPTSHDNTLSPIHHRKHATTTTTTTTPDTRKPKNLEEHNSGSLRGLWPSSTTSSSNTPNNNTLADHLGKETLKDLLVDNNNATFLNRQQSCTEFSRFVEKDTAKENNKPTTILGGSMRYTGKFKFPGKSSSSSSRKSTSSSSSSTTTTTTIVPGRLSVDENVLYRARRPNCLTDTSDIEGSECSDLAANLETSSLGKSSPVTYMSSTANSRRLSGLEVSSKPIMAPPSRRNSDSMVQNPVSLDSSPKLKKFTIKNAIKRANSYGSVPPTQWASSPGRSNSMDSSSKGLLKSFSNLKPPMSPSRGAKGVEKLLNMGLELFKSKKSSSFSSSNLSPVGSGMTETIHQLRLLHNRWIQWRFVNARTGDVNENLTKQAESNLLNTWGCIQKLQHSVMQKKLQLQKEQLGMKLDFILHSQIKPLEAWGDMERQHLSTLLMTKESFHSVVCRVPLIEGAKVDTQSASVTLRHASDLSSSIKSMLTAFSPGAEKTVSLLSELAEVVAQEKSLIEECLELFSIISTLEIQERSLKSSMIQLQLCLQQQQENVS